jgi:nucleotide-binding universal stress UspA family protein
MRSILLHIADDASLKARTQVALDLARTFGAHVDCLQPVPFDYGIPGDVYGGMAAEVIPALRQAANGLRDEYARKLAAEDAAWSWEQVDGPALEYLLRRGAISDLVVLGSREPLSNRPSRLAQDAAVRLRTPMMLVPEDATGLDCTGPALVAWNGSIEASHALKSALPLLRKARSVVLLSVTGEPASRAEFPAVDGAKYLSRHGIGCEITEIPLESGSVAAVLTQAARSREAAYLVMGAYGHSRLVETILGGVTRDLFANPPLPILTCH